MRLLLVLAVLASSGVADAAPVGALDVDLSATQHGWVLSDSIFEVAFPGQPNVDTSSVAVAGGIEAPAVTVVLDRGSSGSGLVVMAVPHQVAYDVARGVAGVRDQSLAAVHAKLVSDKAEQLDGQAVRHIVAMVPGVSPQRIDLYVQWDAAHRTMFELMAWDRGETMTAATAAFVGSFKRHDGPRAPLDPAPAPEHDAVPTGVLDFALVRDGTHYTVRDGLFEATFPARPMVTLGEAASSTTGMDARTYVNELDWFSTGVVSVPAGVRVDTKMIFGQATKLWLSDLTDIKHQDRRGPVAGIAGMHITFAAKKDHRPVHGELDVGWDAQRRIIVVGLTYTPRSKLGAEHRAFLASLAIHPGGTLPTK